MRYEFSSIYRCNPAHIVRYTWDQGQTGYSSKTDSTISSTSYYQSPINWAISYDSRNRITGFNRPSAQASYSYDANSNRLSAINKKVSDSDLDGDFDQADKAQTIAQSQNIDTNSNQLLGFTQTTTGTKGTRTLAITTSQVSYALDAAGNMTTDGLRSFSYDSANRHSQTTVTKGGEASKITYLHNALGQRVFKSEPQAQDYKPNEAALGTDFIAWLKKNFSWLFAQAQTNATLGQSYVYADSGSQLPGYALLGEYGNGGASSSGRLEYIWLPTEGGDALPIGLLKNGNFFAVHSDHLNTPRKITDETNKLVWQWPYSAFGDNKPTGILKATVNPNNAYTQDPTTNARLQATNPAITFNLRMPGQYFDFETGLFYNYFRSYQPSQGRFTQADPIGLDGGWSRFVYANGDAINGFDSWGLETCLLTTVGPGGIRDHAAVYTSRGDGKGGPAIYDPAGAYSPANQGGNGDIVTGSAANKQKYRDFHKSQTVETSCKNTSRAEEESIIDKASELPSAAPFQCAVRSSTALSGHQSFPNVKPRTFWPGNLLRQVR